MKPPFLDIIPHRFRRRSLGVTLSVFTRALLNFAGLAVLIPVLVIILDTEGIRSNRWLAALYDFGGFTSDRMFILTVCACVVAVILFKSLANLALYKIERNFIYDLYRELSRRLYVDYRNRGLGFIKSSNSAVLARNVNVVCLTFVTGVLMPVAAMTSEAVLFALLFGSLAIYNPLVALLTLAIFVPSVALYYCLVRQRLNRYGEEENRAQRRKSRTVIETFRGYADLEIAGAYPAMLSDFDRSMDEIIRVRQRNATIAALPPMFTEVGLTVGMAVLVAFCAGTDNTQMKLLFGIFAVAALRIMPSVRSIMGAWTSLRYNRYTIDVLRDARLYDTPAGIDTTQERMPFEREIRIEGLSFHFDDAPDRDILHDLSLTIRKGERIGIRGASGVGKTTLFNILLGFYRPTAGRITIDGRPLDETNLRKWQNTIGYVSQSVFIADSSFMQNVALGCDPDRIDRRRAAQALETAKLKEFIDTLPQGMETPIGECGCRLSGGQRQRHRPRTLQAGRYPLFRRSDLGARQPHRGADQPRYRGVVEGQPRVDDHRRRPPRKFVGLLRPHHHPGRKNSIDMDYLVAQDLIRSEHLDLVREGGLNGFKPFETTCGAATEPLIRLSPAEPLTLDDFAGYRELDRFDFDEAVADCHFGRYDGGRLFYMTAPGQRPVLFAKADGDPLVRSNVAADGRPDPSLLRFGLWMSFGIAHNPHSIAIHSSVIVHSGRAVLFLGESGTGKSTHTRLWREHIPGAQLLNDDSPIVRVVEGVPTVFGSPWSGKTPCYRNESYPIAAFVRLAQAPHNRIARLPVVRAIGALLPSCPPAFAYDAQLQDNICDTLSQLIARVPVYQLECLPDADAARLSFETTIADR